MMRLTGAYEHTLDAKGRLVVPAALRAPLLESGGYLTKELDGCLGLLPPAVFDAISEKWAAGAADGRRRDRDAQRSFMAGAAPVELDRHGRIAIPRNLREFARLASDCVVVGLGNRIEIWWANGFADVEAAGDEHLSNPDEEPEEDGDEPGGAP